MPGYAAQIPVDDRWAIVAYVRVLQRAHSGSADDVPAHMRQAAMPESPAAATADSTNSARPDALVGESAADPVSAGETK